VKRSALTRSASVGALLAAALCGGCVWTGVQRWPGPMRATNDPLPPGDTAVHRPGPEEVTVVRHADPVQIRPAGALSGRPMEFFDKRAQLNAGGAVIVSPGGRAEVLWPSGASAVILGESVAWVGSPSRGEPILEFDELERARLELREGDSVRILGGSLLSGAGGPFTLEHLGDEVVTVSNQGKEAATISFREERFELAPNQAVRVPLLSSGGAPFVDDVSLRRFDGTGFSVRVGGELACEELGPAIVVRAPEGVAGEARALGLRAKLASGESVRFQPLSVRAGTSRQPAVSDPSETASPVPSSGAAAPLR
jgi:hypothetical protein